MRFLRRVARSAFFSTTISDPTPWQVISWWETRRIPYNILVGAVGLCSGALCLVTGLLSEGFLGDAFGIPNPPVIAMFAVAGYALGANVCYTGGWLAELLVRKLWPEEGKGFGKISFFPGLMFSMLLTLAPGCW